MHEKGAVDLSLKYAAKYFVNDTVRLLIKTKHDDM